MNSILRLGARFLPQELRNVRGISMSQPLRLKEILETQNGKQLVIEGVHLDSPRTPYLLKGTDPKKCSICSLGVEVKHTDVLIVSQFVRSDGCMLPRRVTGLCRAQQKRMSSLVTMAQKAGLMPNLNPSWSKKDPKTRNGWKKYNKYFDENTIKMRKIVVKA